MTWQEAAKAKRQSVFDAIPKEWLLPSVPSPEEEPNASEYLDRILPAKETTIAHTTVQKLLKQLESGELTAYEVTLVFAHRAALLHQLTNCCSEIFIDQALERAKQLDEYYAKHHKLSGPLHGIPVSLKDQVNLEGLDSAMGFVSLANHPKQENEVAALAVLLQNMGAIFYVKTTTPPAMMAFTTTSLIYGETVNSLNRKLSCGGSSGGEGALVGAYGAPLGFGTDIGGSIRVPSSFQGIYGLKGSTSRFPYLNLTNSFAHQPVLSSVVGPMAPDLLDLKYVAKLLIDAKPWLLDPKVPPIEWRESFWNEDNTNGKKTKKKFAVMRWNGVAHPAPPVARAVETTVSKLKSQGYEIVEWNPPVSSTELTQVAIDVYAADGYKEVVDICKLDNEPLIPEILSLAGGFADAMPEGIQHIHEHWEQAKKKYTVQQKVDKYWFEETKKLTSDGKPVDGLIAPVFDVPSFKTADVGEFIGEYTAQFNTLDYSVVVVPVLKADKTIDVDDKGQKYANVQENKIAKYYNAEEQHGTPVGIQVVTPRWQEESALLLAEIVDEALKV